MKKKIAEKVFKSKAYFFDGTNKDQERWGKNAKEWSEQIMLEQANYQKKLL